MLQHTMYIRIFGAILVSEMKGTKQTEWHFEYFSCFICLSLKDKYEF